MQKKFILARKSKLNRSYGGDIFINIMLLLFGAFMFLPMLYAIVTALKPLDELWIFPPRFFVSNPTLNNFTELFRIMDTSDVPFSRYIFNTVFISVVGTGGHLLIASMCAYALAKHPFPGRNWIFTGITMALMFNATVLAIPNFLIMTEIGWIDTYAALIIPAFASPLGLYLMKQFMEQMVPDTVLEAARIDSAGELYIFFKIVMPMVKPAWLTLIIFSFQNLWNLGASQLIFSEQLKTVNYAISQILAGGVARTGAAAAATVVMMAVPVLVFTLSQSQIVETMSTSGMKD